MSQNLSSAAVVIGAFRVKINFLCLTKCPTLINWTSQFPVLRFVGCFFLIFIQILIENSAANIEYPDQTPR